MWKDSANSMNNCFDQMMRTLGATDAHGGIFDNFALQTISDTATVLDIGCGDGRLALKLAKRGQHVVAIDFFAEAIAMANKRSTNIRNVRFLHQSIEQFMRMDSDRCYDAVVAVRVLHHLTLPELESFIHHVRTHLLAEGGILFVIDICERKQSLHVFFSSCARLSNCLSGFVASIRACGVGFILRLPFMWVQDRRIRKNEAWRRHIAIENVPNWDEWTNVFGGLPAYSMTHIFPRQFVMIWHKRNKGKSKQMR